MKENYNLKSSNMLNKSLSQTGFTAHEVMTLHERSIESCITEFRKNRYLKFSGFFTDAAFDALQQETLALLDRHSKRKDFAMEETEFTLRKISTVSGNVIHATSPIITDLYANKHLISFLEQLAGTALYLTPDMDDRHAIHRLHREGDEHGAHVDTYPYVFIICLEGPGDEGGGELKFVYDSKNISDLESDRALCDVLRTGECYFMHSGLNVHCVLPLKKDVHRTVLVLTYADAESKDIDVSYSSSKLYN